MVPQTDGFDFGISVDAEGVIDTLDPVEDSYVIRPLNNLQEGENGGAYDTYIYASYDTSPDTTVNVDIRETGNNRWKIFSEKTNYFDEHVSLSLSGPVNKWHTSGVAFNKKNGDYSIIF
jgi:hypothetical protein